MPGHVFQEPEGRPAEFEIGLTLSTREPIHYLEIIKDGKVEHEVRFDEYAKSGRLPKVRFDRSGWFLVRAVTDLPKTYRFAMTGPYYVEIGATPRISKRSAQFFLDWVTSANGRSSWTTPSSVPTCWPSTRRPGSSGRTCSPRPTPSRDCTVGFPIPACSGPAAGIICSTRKTPPIAPSQPAFGTRRDAPIRPFFA